VLSADYWATPLRWNREAEYAGVRRRVFCSSMCDVFDPHPTVAEQRERLWPLIRATPDLDWLILTKRPENAAGVPYSDYFPSMLPDNWGPQGYPNVWLGVSIENNDYVFRANLLREIPAVVRFVNYGPALGPLDQLDLTGIDWVIYEGESGPGFRDHDLAWPRDMRRRCAEAGKAFLALRGSREGVFLQAVAGVSLRAGHRAGRGDRAAVAERKLRITSYELRKKGGMDHPAENESDNEGCLSGGGVPGGDGVRRSLEHPEGRADGPRGVGPGGCMPLPAQEHRVLRWGSGR
jgi:protein gp37